MKKNISIVFLLLIILFITTAIINENFFNWIYSRHQNQLSWYIRPIFIIPFCYFSYRHSWTGIIVTIFLLLTSMAWFPVPTEISNDVKQFLQYEKKWLSGDWTIAKIFLFFLVPFSLFVLGLSFWKRSFWFGTLLIVLIAAGKIIWSIENAEQSGKSIIMPAITGLVVCIVFIYLGFKKLEKK